MITRILYRLRRRRRWTEPDTLTRLPIPAAISGGSRADDTISTQPEVAGDDELIVRARLFLLLGVGGPR